VTDVPGFSGDGRPVVLLTLREAQAIRTALQQWALVPATLDTEDSDLGRGYRVLRNQIEWCMQPRVLRKHAKKAS
jgi:hypothetical protein